MFNKNVFTQKDPIADLVKPMLEAQVAAKTEELKGNQKVLDKNKNNKLDSQDFKILRGEKKAVKEDSEQVEEGWDDMLKAVKDRAGPQPSGGSGKKAGKRYGGSAQKEKPEQDDKKKVKEEVEQVDEASYSAKAARAGKDIGKPGKMFKKIAKKAAARYGSMAKGKDVAGALLAKLRKEETDFEPLLIDRIVEDTMSAIEQLDELKKTTVKSYIKKKMDQVYKTGAPPSMSHVKKTMTNLQRAHDRNTGVKPTSEETVMEAKKEEKKDDTPFEGPYKKKESAKAGKYGSGYSTARHLARQGMKKAVKEDVEEIEERTLTPGETSERERIVKGMKKNLAGFKARYGEKAKSVMYATATKAAKKD